MRRSSIAFAAVLAGAVIAPQALAANIDQNGDYLYTFTRTDGVSTYAQTRHLNARQMQRLSARAAEHLPRFQDIGRDCSSGGTYANRAALDQSGTGNAAWVSQAGHNDGASIAQSGNDNAAYALQSGNGLQAATTQAGNHNLALSIQSCRSPRSVLLGRFLQYGL
jgi:hypothetical protein